MAERYPKRKLSTEEISRALNFGSDSDDSNWLKHELNEHIASVHEEENQSAHNDCMIMCHSCEKPATHFCKSCDQNLCKFCIIDHYRNTNFTKNHDMIPL